ncbi:MAG: hypothetical protein AAF318_14315 [Pseudomonadota bacterium]
MNGGSIGDQDHTAFAHEALDHLLAGRDPAFTATERQVLRVTRVRTSVQALEASVTDPNRRSPGSLPFILCQGTAVPGFGSTVRRCDILFGEPPLTQPHYTPASATLTLHLDRADAAATMAVVGQPRVHAVFVAAADGITIGGVYGWDT